MNQEKIVAAFPQGWKIYSMDIISFQRAMEYAEKFAVDKYVTNIDDVNYLSCAEPIEDEMLTEIV